MLQFLIEALMVSSLGGLVGSLMGMGAIWVVATVTPLPALARGAFADDLAALLPLLRHRAVRALVVGLPLDAEQRPTAQARHCRRYGERLAHSLAQAGLPMPLSWVNEHASTWEAGERFGLHGDRSGRLDSAAAALLLEQWLRETPAAIPPPDPS
jgi:putative Holliday junction resolvase